MSDTKPLTCKTIPRELADTLLETLGEIGREKMRIATALVLREVSSDDIAFAKAMRVDAAEVSDALSRLFVDDSNDKIGSFLRDIEEVCKRHNISIGHEDGHGSFLILDYDDPRGSFGEGAYYDDRKKVR